MADSERAEIPLIQAVRDAIEALKTPMPREVVAEQLQRALDGALALSLQDRETP